MRILLFFKQLSVGSIFNNGAFQRDSIEKMLFSRGIPIFEAKMLVSQRFIFNPLWIYCIKIIQRSFWWGLYQELIRHVKLVLCFLILIKVKGEFEMSTVEGVWTLFWFAAFTKKGSPRGAFR